MNSVVNLPHLWKGIIMTFSGTRILLFIVFFYLLFKEFVGLIVFVMNNGSSHYTSVIISIVMAKEQTIR